MSAWIALAMLIVAAALLLATPEGGTIAGITDDSFARLVAGLALVIFLGSWALRSYRGRFAAALRDLSVWVLALLFVVSVYAYRAELMIAADRIAGELLPPGMQIVERGSNTTPAKIRLRRGWGGHFSAPVTINGQTLKMVVDTGASAVVLSARDAQKIGVNPRDLSFTVPIQTANGRAFAARARARTIAVGPIVRSNIEVLVTAPGALQESLLGMSFLSRLRSYEFSGEYLTLRG